MSSHEPECRYEKDGFILVTVLWILAALAALAAVYSIYVANTAATARLYDDRLQVRALVSAGIELTAYRLLGLDDAHRPTSGAFGVQIGRSRVDVAFQAKIRFRVPPWKNC